MSKGSAQRPGEGYAEGFDRVFGKQVSPLQPFAAPASQHSATVPELPSLPLPDVCELEPVGPPTAYSAASVRFAQRAVDLQARQRVAVALGLGDNGLNEGRPTSFGWGYLLAVIAELNAANDAQGQPAGPAKGGHDDQKVPPCATP